uniref:Uncharacterized protein n=1 Tax=Cacopsylla melanoneura TaxID=428564 RepID=A0A8D8SHZ7_9HEMI
MEKIEQFTRGRRIVQMCNIKPMNHIKTPPGRMKKTGGYTEEERKTIEKAFKENFKLLKGPNLRMILAARKKYPVLASRTTNQLMGFVNNAIQKQKSKNSY